MSRPASCCISSCLTSVVVSTNIPPLRSLLFGCVNFVRLAFFLRCPRILKRREPIEVAELRHSMPCKTQPPRCLSPSMSSSTSGPGQPPLEAHPPAVSLFHTIFCVKFYGGEEAVARLNTSLLSPCREDNPFLFFLNSLGLPPPFNCQYGVTRGRGQSPSTLLHPTHHRGHLRADLWCRASTCQWHFDLLHQSAGHLRRS